MLNKKKKIEYNFVWSYEIKDFPSTQIKNHCVLFSNKCKFIPRKYIIKEVLLVDIFSCTVDEESGIGKHGSNSVLVFYIHLHTNVIS